MEFNVSTCEDLTDQSCASISEHCMVLEVLGLRNLKNITGSGLSSLFLDEKRAKQFRSISLSGSKKVSVYFLAQSCSVQSTGTTLHDDNYVTLVAVVGTY